MRKKPGILLILLFFICSMQARAISINDTAVFLKQPRDGDGTCVFTSCLNMFRRRAILDGQANWAEITHEKYKYTITTDGALTRWTIQDVQGMDGGMTFVGGKTTAEKKAYCIDMLAAHPEGIVIYSAKNPMHTVLLTDYKDGTFYAVETLGTYPAGKIPLLSTYLAKNSSGQDAVIEKISKVWHVTNRSGAPLSPHTKTEICGSTFTTAVYGAAEGTRVILALYENGRLADMQCAVYEGEALAVKSDAAYDTAKVLLFRENSIEPLGAPEIL